MRSHYQLDVALTLLGPILTRGGQAGEPGVDAPLARDALGRPMLPYSLVKGKVLDALRDLGRADDPRVRDWLGRPSADGGEDPERGRLRFGDFATEQTGTSTDQVIERIQIDPGTGGTTGRMLAMIESPFGYDEPVVFAGKVEFVADEREADAIRGELDAAFRWVPAYGAMRTVGFGRTRDVRLTLARTAPSAVGSPPPAASLPVRLRLDRPLCVVGAKHGGNHFDSLECIPGAVLKGAAARLVLELTGSTERVLSERVPGFPNLCRHFERVRFAEARPVRLADAPARPVEPPLSLVTCPTGRMKGRYFDVARDHEPRLIDGAAPAFAPDWKADDRERVRAAFGWPRLPTERRTRTAIDHATGRAADEKLFSYRHVRPREKQADGSVAEFAWETAVGLGAVPPADRAAVAGELHDLLACGLPNVGKTRAVARVEWLQRPTPPKVGERALPAGRHVVTLQTECLMTDPDGLKAGDLGGAYRDFWARSRAGRSSWCGTSPASRCTAGTSPGAPAGRGTSRS